jgi:hypothetical protein
MESNPKQPPPENFLSTTSCNISLSVGERLTTKALPWALVWLVCAIAASISTAHFMRRWIEIPSIRLGKRLKIG